MSSDETLRDLERLAREGDQSASLRLLAEWRRRGEIKPEGFVYATATRHDLLGDVSLSFTAPQADGVKRDVLWVMGLHDVMRGNIRRGGGRGRGVVIRGNAGPVDELVWALAKYGSLGRVASNVTDVVSSTSPNSRPIDLSSISWPDSVRSDVQGYAGSNAELHEVVRLVLDEFWEVEEWRLGLIERLLKFRLAHRAAQLDQIRRQFEKLEEAVATAVEDEIQFSDGEIDFYPPSEDEE